MARNDFNTESTDQDALGIDSKLDQNLTARVSIRSLSDALSLALTRYGVSPRLRNKFEVTETSPQSTSVQIKTGAAVLGPVSDGGVLFSLFNNPVTIDLGSPLAQDSTVIVGIELDNTTGQSATSLVKFATIAGSSGGGIPSISGSYGQDITDWFLPLAYVTLRAGATKYTNDDIRPVADSIRYLSTEPQVAAGTVTADLTSFSLTPNLGSTSLSSIGFNDRGGAQNATRMAVSAGTHHAYIWELESYGWARKRRLATVGDLGLVTTYNQGWLYYTTTDGKEYWLKVEYQADTNTGTTQGYQVGGTGANDTVLTQRALLGATDQPTSGSGYRFICTQMGQGFIAIGKWGHKAIYYSQLPNTNDNPQFVKTTEYGSSDPTRYATYLAPSANDLPLVNYDATQEVFEIQSDGTKSTNSYTAPILNNGGVEYCIGYNLNYGLSNPVQIAGNVRVNDKWCYWMYKNEKQYQTNNGSTIIIRPNDDVSDLLPKI